MDDRPSFYSQCKHCKGQITTVYGTRGQSFLRCQSCGRTPGGRPPMGLTGAPKPEEAVAKVGERCRVRGCPGTLDSDSRCACCEARSAWEAEHRPKRVCAICAGEMPRTPGGRKLCVACRNIVSVAAREKDALLERQEKEAK